jgi:hypothetical protein
MILMEYKKEELGTIKLTVGSNSEVKNLKKALPFLQQ